MTFHALDEVGVDTPTGMLEHGVVTEVTRVVWVALDTQVLDIPFDPADSRLHLWVAS